MKTKNPEKALLRKYELDTSPGRLPRPYVAILDGVAIAKATTEEALRFFRDLGATIEFRGLA